MPRPFRIKGRERLLQLVIVKLGGDAKLAKKLGISRQAVNLWDDIPPGWVRRVRKLVRDVAVQQ